MVPAIITRFVSAMIIAAGFRPGYTTSCINAIADFEGEIVWNTALFLVESS
jgi:hypothetical protein